MISTCQVHGSSAVGVDLQEFEGAALQPGPPVDDSGAFRAGTRRADDVDDDAGEIVDEGAEALDNVIGEHGEVGVGLLADSGSFAPGLPEGHGGLAGLGTCSLVKAMGYPLWEHSASLQTSDHDDYTTNSSSSST